MSSPGSASLTQPDKRLTADTQAVRVASLRRALPLALVVLLLGVVLTWVGAHYVDRLESARATQEADHAVNRVTSSLLERLNYYTAHMRAAAGLFVASNRVSLFEWERYIATTELRPLNEMGAAGLVYAPRVAADRRADWEDFMFYAYDRVITIRGSTEGAAFPIQFAAPRVSTLEVVLGFDLASSPTRRAAIEAAISRGDVVLSGPVTLQDAGDASPAGILALPVFDPAKDLMRDVPDRDLVRGVVVLGIRYGDWIASVSKDWTDKVRLELFDESGDIPVRLVALEEASSGASVSRRMVVGGRQLRLVFYPVAQLGDSVAGLTVRAAGALMTLAFALLTFYLASGRQRALASAERIGGALEASERRFALAATATSDGIWEWASDRSEMYLSARAQAMLFGGPKPGPIGWRNMLQCLPADERRVLLLALRGHLRHRQPLEVAICVSSADGEHRRLLIRGRAEWDAVGRPTRVAGAISDVSLLHERELALERAREFYARLLDFLPHPVLVKSVDHRYVLANQAAGVFLGRDAERIVGLRTEDVLPGQSAKHLAEDERSLSGVVSTQEFHLMQDNGNEHDAIISKVGVAGLEGEPVVLVTITDVSTLRRTERALKSSLAELDALFRNSPLGMAMIRVDGSIVRVNEAFAQMVGVEADALPGMRYAALTPQRLHALDREKTLDALHQGVVTPYERAFVRPDGTEVPVLLSGAVMRDAEGGTAIWTVVEDISERKAAELALAAAHATNASIIAAMPDMLIQFDANLRLVAVRTRDDVRLIVDMDTAVGRPLDEIISQKRFMQVVPTLRRAQFSGQLQCVEYRAPDGNGNMQDYEARVAPVGTGGLLVVLRNVSELKARERALRESEARFRLLADAAPVVIWLADVQLNITYANRAWLTLTGMASLETLGVDWLRFVHPDDLAAVKEVGREARRTGQAYQLEFRVRREGGTYAWLMAKGEPRVDEQGQVVGFIGVGVDISNEKKAREALREHRDHLAELVTEKTASLIDAKEAAERANEAKSRFLANMSHELRSPMHAVLSYARLGEDKALGAAPEKLRDYFQRIRSSGDRLLRLVDNLLDLSKLEAGRMVLDIQPLVLSTVVAEALDEVEGLRVARGIGLSTEMAADVPAVAGDALRIGQVVRNLLSNAIKFSPSGGQIFVEMSVDSLPSGRRADDNGGRDAVALRVIDQGGGIPETELEAVFDKFVQSSATRTGAGGTGLGLAICREILIAHGGQIHARNIASGGACFEIVLPAFSPVDGNLAKEHLES
ncbi:MAG TPA: PAS domain S-box protein [Denitromonas sp.]|uniref:PAS domain S-box protein n=1 Tax=Denitromonas sp. TaxID=2734609 RepID=UPI001DF71316|nr:PAS domain S-box protein [Rhodocyclaceae bacterium]MCP5221879.1 PAS domain S-box protein [Zoogloeaceae bacterium]HPR05896.1 PAS domain S-box protein [Denitromonas sp.]HQU87981.1 PAS domain S-box protein [Denitromonas sp.]HQV14637.1 PAS domain S-box protein [Denitromonas sp.]